jgi:carbon-monoxide dehydrogenase medium subunit
MPAVCLATGATMSASSTAGTRTIPAEEFFEGYLQTTLRADELLTSVTFPAWPPGTGGSVVEVARRHGDYALVGLAARVVVDDATITEAALAFFGAASTPVRVAAAEAALVGTAPSADRFAEAARIVADELDPPGDLHGSTAYRRHLAGVLTRRALTEATESIGVPA